ncbi:MAG: hypothetical protein IPK04_02540 [Bdellovibrionales bacterium]|jgi:hypothetical protein|nr:hypothetical protein [Bdellovibrionales bacterium]
MNSFQKIFSYQKILLFMVVLAFADVVHARVQVSFMPLNRQAMVITKDEPGDEPISFYLYEQMSVPVQDSFIGPGKSWSTGQREFNMVCSLSPSQGNQCNFIIQNLPDAHLDPNKGYVEYHLRGTAAAEIFQKFVVPAGGTLFEFRSNGGEITIKSTPNEFLFTAHK